MYDYETSVPVLREGRLVLEGRSLHTVAVYQSVIMHSDDGQALVEAKAILKLGLQWRPLPDLAILIVDDVETAVRRAERRDGTRYTQEQWRIHHRAAMLFERWAVTTRGAIRARILTCGFASARAASSRTSARPSLSIGGTRRPSAYWSVRR